VERGGNWKKGAWGSGVCFIEGGKEEKGRGGGGRGTVVAVMAINGERPAVSGGRGEGNGMGGKEAMAAIDGGLQGGPG
jgi:hypothetical protein